MCAISYGIARPARLLRSPRNDSQCKAIENIMSEVSRSLVAASSRPLILAVLAQAGESYGYDIILRIRDLSGGVLDWQEGMLYPVLHRLEEEGLIAARWGLSEQGRKRKYYRLQRQGAEALREEMAQWLQVHRTLMKLMDEGQAGLLPTP